ncbi:Tail Fiber protein [Enterobacter cloacae]|uniref:phage tail-collar fiber domain-containing protein n=3 Tax=Enterobacter TaxID=547 RepID=UPI0007969C29|nr:phage tail protein [Enterobacter cloacae]CZV71779.1 Tail Fiber protein [Enterobacter cloacae]
MTVKYKTVITKAGAIKLAAATIPGGKKVNFTAMAVGDGGGALPTPDPNQTKLIKEVWRHALNKISQDRKNKNYVVAELLIPPETGGFWMRELGLYDDAGTLIAVGNMAESYKPTLAEGSGRAQTVRMVIMVSDIESVELSIDTSTVMATQDYVDDKLAEHEQSRRHPDATLTAKGFTQLSSAIDSVSESVAATPKAIKAAYDLAKGKYTAQDATTAQKGIVQLSSATDSASEALAATPKAVKAAYDLAKGKYTAQDGTTAQKGIVQLSSATDSASETLAATPKAVSAAAKAIKDTLGTSSSKDIVISKTDTTTGRVLTTGWMSLGGYGTDNLIPGVDALKPLRNGFYAVQNEASYGNASLISFGYDSGSQVHIIAKQGGQAPMLGVCGSTPQGVFGGWGKIYTEFYKPTAGEVGAVAKTGDTMTGRLIVNVDGEAIRLQPKTAGYASYLISVDSANVNHWYVGAGSTNNADVVFNNYKGGNNSINLKSDGSINISATNGKNVTVTGQVIPSNYGNFDVRYVLPDGATYAGFVSGDATRPYMRHRVSNAVVELAKRGDAYTKAESENRYQPKGSYTPAGQAYTKGESDGKYVTQVRLGSVTSTGQIGNRDLSFGNGIVLTGLYGSANYTVNLNIYYRAVQYLINGVWYTATSV